MRTARCCWRLSRQAAPGTCCGAGWVQVRSYAALPGMDRWGMAHSCSYELAPTLSPSLPSDVEFVDRALKQAFQEARRMH